MNKKGPQPNDFINDSYRRHYATPQTIKARPVEIPTEIVKTCHYCQSDVQVNPAGERTLCGKCLTPVNHGEIES